MHRRRVRLEVAELLLLLGVQPPLTTSLLWRLVKAAVLVGHNKSLSQTGWHTEACDVKRLLLLPIICLMTPAAMAESTWLLLANPYNGGFEKIEMRDSEQCQEMRDYWWNNGGRGQGSYSVCLKGK